MVAPKNRTFWWRALTDIIPVTINLKPMNLAVNNVCCICEQPGESVQHAYLKSNM